MGGVGAHNDVSAAQSWFGELAQSRNPLLHETDFLTADESRRAEIEDNRLRRIESTRPSAKPGFVDRRLHFKPMIEQLSASLANAIRRNAVHFYSLSFLDRVPNYDSFRTNLNQTFIREIVPARDDQDRRNSERARRLDVVSLVITELDD